MLHEPTRRGTWVPILLTALLAAAACGGEDPGEDAPTHVFAASAPAPETGPRLRLDIVDAAGGAPLPARFSLFVDGTPYTPPALDRGGIHFTSIHHGKRQRATLLYARGTGPVEMALPAGATRGEVVVARGYAWLPTRQAFAIDAGAVQVTAALQRATGWQGGGWVSADTHLHYARRDPSRDADWLAMLAADDLTQGHLLVLEGGNLPGVWAEQFAYGAGGRADDGAHVVIPGEEFRGAFQGHATLLGIGHRLDPLSVGGLAGPRHPWSWPAMHDVLHAARESGGVGGPAHGGIFGEAPTAILDAVLGAAAFVEIANTHLYALDPWYRLLGSGFLLPPVAGTDLPNHPYPDPEQPFLGETRTYVRAGDPRDFEAWKAALGRGEVFVTSGPLLRLEVGDDEDGTRHVIARAHSVEPLAGFEIVLGGRPLDLPVTRTRDAAGAHAWRIDARIPVARSTWIAARATGREKVALREATGWRQRRIAHTAPIAVIVDDAPIGSAQGRADLVGRLRDQRAVYAMRGRFPDAASRTRMLALFDRAIARLEARP